MSKLDKFFTEDESPAFSSFVEAWKPLIQRYSGKITCRIERDFDGMSYGPTSIILNWVDEKDDPKTSEIAPWDDALNEYLLKNQIRATTGENESLRFAILIRQMLKPLEVKVGDGYYNAVAVETINEAFEDCEIIQERIRKIGANNPYVGRSYEEATRTVTFVITQAATLLTKSLVYEREEAELILTNAIVQFLEERFSLNSIWMS